MICERCGEIAETFMTEKHREPCEVRQKLVEAEDNQSPFRPRKIFEQEG